ncbi:MAG TPA: GNAT family N-acetyltransferase [Chitinophagaceae bacterium]|nr:GNAT family N-acetyltransferase [Chitinophagaceae bacterium]
MSVIIRLATKQDAELIAGISRETFYETFAAQNKKEDIDIFMNKVFTRKELIKEVGLKGNIFLLAYSEDEVAGYVRMRESNAPPALGNAVPMEIARIYTTKKFIGKGVGHALMEKSIVISKEMKKEVVWLGVWEKNQRAIDFYLKWGFEKFDEHDFVLGNDIQKDWLMKKILS